MNVRIITVIAAIAGAAALRLVPHPPNFSPIDAMALFGGSYLGRRWLAFAAPIGALLVSDLVLGFYPGMLVQYGAVALIVGLGIFGLRRRSAIRIGGAALGASLLFFLVTNFAVWASSGMYAHTAAGLASCYVAAIPFLQNTIAADLFYSALLFGGFALLGRAVPALNRAGELRPA